MKNIREIFKIGLDNSAAFRYIKNMSGIRDVILKRMSEMNLTTYKLCKMVEGQVPKRTIYDFISGKSDAGTEVASVLMEALGLTITIKRNMKRGKRPRKES